MRKTTLLEINLGPGHDANCVINLHGKSSDAVSHLLDIKDSGMQICAFCTTKIL